jgi:diaminopimelate epimerase
MNIVYMNGAGNDFMVADVRGLKEDLSTLAKRACAITGADGFMAVDVSEIADFRLHFYNSDGSRGEMCGNGSRCVCRFAYEQGIAGADMTVQTDAGLIRVQRLDESRYRVALNTPGILEPERKPGVAYIELGSPGIPHAVVEVPALRWEDRDALRPEMEALRHDPAFPKGANVNFFTQLDETTLRILTYERYVEDFTLACGTGSGAAAALLWATGRLPGGRVAVENPGGTLSFELSGQAGRVERLLMEGPTEIVRVYEI